MDMFPNNLILHDLLRRDRFVLCVSVLLLGMS
jgi:hypothetical protein